MPDFEQKRKLSILEEINIFNQIGCSALERYVKLTQSIIGLKNPDLFNDDEFNFLSLIKVKLEKCQPLEENEMLNLASLLEEKSVKTDD